MPPTITLPTDLDRLASELEEASEVSPPTNTRALLYRIDERSGMALHAVGRLAREVSKVTEELKLLRIELKGKVDRETMRDVRKKVDSVTNEVEDSRQIHISGLQAQLKALEDEKKSLEHEKKEAAREEAHNKEFWKRWFIIAVVSGVTTLTAWAVKEVYTLATHPQQIVPIKP